jgi:hypothetical protein
MASGIHGSCNRPKSGKNLHGAAKKKRHKNDSEKQAVYKKKIADRRAKRNKK